MGFNLSSKEFIFLCYAVGAKRMYGIEDSFTEVNAADMHSEIRKVHNSLEEKHYIESDFDGNTTIDKRLLQEFQCCVNSTKQVLFNCSKRGFSKKVYFYFDEKIAVKVVKTGDDYVLEQFDKKLLPDDLFSNLSLKSGNEINGFSETVILQKELSRIKKCLSSSGRNEVVDELNIKFGETIASQLVSALEEEEDFYSIAVIDADFKNCFNSIMIIDTNTGALLLKPCVIELENAVTVTACTRNEIRLIVNELICRILK